MALFWTAITRDSVPLFSFSFIIIIINWVYHFPEEFPHFFYPYSSQQGPN